MNVLFKGLLITILFLNFCISYEIQNQYKTILELEDELIKNSHSNTFMQPFIILEKLDEFIQIEIYVGILNHYYIDTNKISIDTMLIKTNSTKFKDSYYNTFKTIIPPNVSQYKKVDIDKRNQNIANKSESSSSSKSNNSQAYQEKYFNGDININIRSNNIISDHLHLTSEIINNSMKIKVKFIKKNIFVTEDELKETISISDNTTLNKCYVEKLKILALEKSYLKKSFIGNIYDIMYSSVFKDFFDSNCNIEEFKKVSLDNNDRTLNPQSPIYSENENLINSIVEDINHKINNDGFAIKHSYNGKVNTSGKENDKDKDKDKENENDKVKDRHLILSKLDKAFIHKIDIYKILLPLINSKYRKLNLNNYLPNNKINELNKEFNKLKKNLIFSKFYHSEISEEKFSSIKKEIQEQVNLIQINLESLMGERQNNFKVENTYTFIKLSIIIMILLILLKSIIEIRARLYKKYK